MWFCDVSRESTTASDEVGDSSKQDANAVYKPWAPGGYVAFRLLLASRMCAALWSNISDCDETYNYWEPVCLFPASINLPVNQW